VNALGAGLVAAFAVLAIANWLAVIPDRPDGRKVALTKTAATIALIAIAVLVGDMAGEARAALVVAAGLCLGGDVALLGHSDERFIAGLGCFAAGHVAYIATAVLVGVSWPRLAAAFPFLAALFGFRFVTRTIP